MVTFLMALPPLGMRGSADYPPCIFAKRMRAVCSQLLALEGSDRSGAKRDGNPAVANCGVIGKALRVVKQRRQRVRFSLISPGDSLSWNESPRSEPWRERGYRGSLFVD